MHLDDLCDIAEILADQKENRIAAYTFANKLMYHYDDGTMTSQEIIDGLFLIEKVTLYGSELSGTVASMIDIDRRNQAPKQKSLVRRK